MESKPTMPRWVAGLMVLSFVLLVGLVVRRALNPLPPEFSRRVPSPSNDPTVRVAQYSNIVDRLKGYEYVAIPSITDEQLRLLIETETAGLARNQKYQLLSNLTNLIAAHFTGDARHLHDLMWTSPCFPTGWSEYAQHRLSIILTSGGLKMREINAIMEKPSWEVVERAWNIMVAEHALTNWWASVSLKNSRCWIHVAPRGELPSVDSDFYGEFAGTVVGTSLFEYSAEGPSQSNSNSVTVAAVRLTLRFKKTEKPIVYVFRWEWSELHQVWRPLDRCIGVVGLRPPDPFF
jgi:hypothetical protein